jgi:O-antigen/teichoic acid export membrane protein
VNALVLARHLAPGEYGTFTAAYATVSLAAFLMSWGLDTWLLRESAVIGDVRLLAGHALATKALLGIPWLIVLVIGLPSLSSDVFLRPLVLVCATDILCDSLFNAQTAALNGTQRSGPVSALLLVSRGARLAATIVLMMNGARDASVFAGGRAAGTALSLLAVSAVLRPTVAGWSFPAARRMLRSSVSFGLSDVLAAIYLQADVTLLAVLLGNRQAVGLYAPASSLINALFVIPNAAYLVVLPMITATYVTRRAGIGFLTRNTVLAFGALGLLLAAACYLVGGLVTEVLLGAAYRPTGVLLSVLSPILFFKALSYAGAAFLVAVSWQQRRVRVQAASAAANVLANVPLILAFGVWGAVWAYVLSELILASGYLLLVWSWFRQPRVSVG